MSTSQAGYKALSKDLEQFNVGSAPPPPYEQQQQLQQQQQPMQQQAPQITVAPNVHMAANLSSGGNMGIPMPVGPHSTEMNCPQCRCRIKTKVRHRSTAKTHIACLLLSWTFCCCCLPYCMDSCRNANHFCPMCGAFVGTYQS